MDLTNARCEMFPPSLYQTKELHCIKDSSALGVPVMAQRLVNRTSSMRMWVRSLALLSGLRICIAVGCGLGRKCSSDPSLLWPWPRLATAASLRPLAWELPYAMGAALKKREKQNKQTNKKNRKKEFLWWFSGSEPN